jgi:hypothetical protein
LGAQQQWRGSGLLGGGSIVGGGQEGRVQALVEWREHGRVEVGLVAEALELGFERAEAARVRRLPLRQFLAGHLRYRRPAARRRCHHQTEYPTKAQGAEWLRWELMKDVRLSVLDSVDLVSKEC